MRGHPLVGRPTRLLGAGLAATMLVGCSGTGPPTTTLPPDSVGVTIASAPGETLAFVPAETTVPSPGPVAITFRNGSSLDHNMVFTDGLAAATRTIVMPGTSDQLLLKPRAAGSYRFVCTIHEGMAGTLVVGGR